MGNLQIIENQLMAMKPKFEQVLSSSGVPAERVIRTVMVSLEKTPALANCSAPSILQAAMSASILGIEVDGVTGQGYLLPFGGKAQLVVGYKGYNTIAARSGYTITGSIVREGDEFDYQLGTKPNVHHVPKNSKGNITHAWAVAQSRNAPPIVRVMDIDELMQVKAKSPGGRRKDSPWNDPGVGFAAMCEKTVKRRLARDMPLNLMQVAASMEQGFEEMGHHSYVDPQSGVVYDAEPTVEKTSDVDAPIIDLEPAKPFHVRIQRGNKVEFDTIQEWYEWITTNLPKAKSKDQLQQFLDRNQDMLRDVYNMGHEGMANAVVELIEELKQGMKG